MIILIISKIIILNNIHSKLSTIPPITDKAWQIWDHSLDKSVTSKSALAAWNKLSAGK